MNYSEFSPVASAETDKNGCCRITTGKGSLAVQISWEDWWTCIFADTRVQNKYTVTVGENQIQEGKWIETDMTAPVDTPVNPSNISPEEKALRDTRLKEAAARRTSKTENWKNPECGKFLRGEAGEDASDGDTSGILRQEMLEVLTEKDQTDLKADILEEHLKYSLPYEENTEHSLFVSCILNPRIDDEVLMKYREAVEMGFSEEEKKKFREDPSSIWNTVEKKIISLPERERESVITTPLGCLKTGVGSLRSKKSLRWLWRELLESLQD